MLGILRRILWFLTRPREVENPCPRCKKAALARAYRHPCGGLAWYFICYRCGIASPDGVSKRWAYRKWINQGNQKW